MSCSEVAHRWSATVFPSPSVYESCELQDEFTGDGTTSRLMGCSVRMVTCDKIKLWEFVYGIFMGYFGIEAKTKLWMQGGRARAGVNKNCYAQKSDWERGFPFLPHSLPAKRWCHATSVMFIGELMKLAEQSLAEGLHPRLIAEAWHGHILLPSGKLT